MIVGLILSVALMSITLWLSLRISGWFGFLILGEILTIFMTVLGGNLYDRII
jgi:hypothetical protein